MSRFSSIDRQHSSSMAIERQRLDAKMQLLKKNLDLQDGPKFAPRPRSKQDGRAGAAGARGAAQRAAAETAAKGPSAAAEKSSFAALPRGTGAKEKGRGVVAPSTREVRGAGAGLGATAPRGSSFSGLTAGGLRGGPATATRGRASLSLLPPQDSGARTPAADHTPTAAAVFEEWLGGAAGGVDPGVGGEAGVDDDGDCDSLVEEAEDEEMSSSGRPPASAGQAMEFPEKAWRSAEISWLFRESERQDKEAEEVAQLLARSGLDRYAALLQENGFDSMEILREADDSVLEELGLPPSPRARLLEAVKAERSRSRRRVEEGDEEQAAREEEDGADNFVTAASPASPSRWSGREVPGTTPPPPGTSWQKLGRVPPGWHTLPPEGGSSAHHAPGSLGGRVATVRSSAAGPDEAMWSEEEYEGYLQPARPTPVHADAGVGEEHAGVTADNEEILLFNEGKQRAWAAQQGEPTAEGDERVRNSGLLPPAAGLRGDATSSLSSGAAAAAPSSLSSPEKNRRRPATTDPDLGSHVVGTPATSRPLTGGPPLRRAGSTSRPGTAGRAPPPGFAKACCFVCYKQVYVEESESSAGERDGSAGELDGLRGLLRSTGGSIPKPQTARHYCSGECRAKEECRLTSARARCHELVQRRAESRTSDREEEEKPSISARDEAPRSESAMGWARVLEHAAAEEIRKPLSAGRGLPCGGTSVPSPPAAPATHKTLEEAMRDLEARKKRLAELEATKHAAAAGTDEGAAAEAEQGVAEEVEEEENF